jgi:uncharacterized glyoxalase superfamily protein PhnB
MTTLTSHLVTRDPAAAAAWYGSVLGAAEESRITLPGGQVLTVELRFGDSERTGQFIDPFGHRWAIDQHLRDVPADEIARLAAEAFGGGQS